METLLKFRFLFLLLTFFPADAEWIIAPRKLYENNDYRGLEYIARIRSDKENFTKVIYSLHGPGVDEPPLHVFGINSISGYVKIYEILDREKIASYQLIGVATFTNGSRAEKDIPLPINVLDMNDCTPVIKQQTGFVNESSAIGTVVMKVIATDGDQENTPHSQIIYSLVEQSNTGGMFFLNSQTGEVMVQKRTLDREEHDTYTLTVRAADLNGRPEGNVGTGQIVIKILDINDNVPTLEKDFYEASVEENTINVEVLRIKAIDMDLIHTDNWLAVYEITDGNQAGYFSITTDSQTNEGIITVHKALDYEELKVVNLEVSVRNKAEYNFGSSGITGAGGVKGYPIKINVINQKEGPRFHPSVKVVTISEDHSSVSLNTVIGTYAAIDTDTQLTATNVRYAKIYDQDNWLIIDEKTADIKLNKLPDRESKFLINGTYYAKIICITNDAPSKTATGTIAIQVEDFNDHCPTLTATTQTLCFEHTAVYVTAVDRDEAPNSAPFEFTVIQGSAGKWMVEHLNETTAILRDHANLWPGIYKVELKISDQQGKACSETQVLEVIVCSCEANTKTCGPRSSKTVEFGASGILLMLLGLLLLLLVPLLLMFCLCGGVSTLGDFKAIPFDTKQQLISYHTEGQGEDKEVPLLTFPVEVDGGGAVITKDIQTLSGGAALGGGGGGGGGGAFGGGTWMDTMDHYNQYSYYGRQGHMGHMQGGTMTGQEHYFSQSRAGFFDGMALSEDFLEEYYSSKANHASHQSEQKDGFLIYDFEGEESLAGSVGCCSLLENDDNLSFLNDLGPKFKTLAEICQGSSIATETVDAGFSIPALRPLSPVKPSTSKHTHVHTHTETLKDRDRVNLNTSHVTSGSSTLIQEEQLTERTLPKVHTQDKIVVPTQTLLIQQPAMYYAATPMYVVDPKQQVVLVTGGAQQAVGQMASVGLTQGMVQVGGLQSSQGMVQVGGLQSSQEMVQVGGLQSSQGMVQVGGLQPSQGVVLVDRQIGATAARQAAQGLSQGSASRSRKVILVEGGSSGREQGVQGIIHTRQGSTGKGLEGTSQGTQMTVQSMVLGSSGSTGSTEDFGLIAPPKAQGSQRVVVQHKKVSVTERNVESRA